jgi:hypothetical protein
VDDLERKSLREMSRIVFGQDYRLELMLEICSGDDQIVTLGDLAKQLSLPPSSIQVPFRALIASGLLSPLPSDDSRRKFYQANKSAAWDWAWELAQQVTTKERLRTGAARLGLSDRS